MISLRYLAAAAWALAVLPGCEKALERAREAREVNRGQQASQEQPAPASRPARPQPKPTPSLDDDEPLPEIAASGFLYQPSPASLAAARGGVDEEVAVARIVAHVRDAVDLDPTLVVWLIDRSQSASKIVFQASRHLDKFYTDVGKGRVAKINPKEPDPRLLTAVVSFGPDVQFPLEKPTGDAQAVIQALGGITVDSQSREATFAAVAAALEKYLPYRTERGRRLLLVMITDEAGDDAERVDEVLAAPRKYGVPVYVIGAPAPFGQVSALPTVGEGASSLATQPPGAAGKAGPALRHGPESLALERVALPSFAGFWRNQVLESGFGPFALERLCRATGGEFLMLQPPGESASGGSLADWPSPLAVRFEPDAMRRYLPDYVSTEAYQKLIDSNGARRALHQAAALEPIDGAFHPETEFPQENQAQLQRHLDQAQRAAARLAPQVDRVYELLQQGEADRALLTEPRWQAGFDLALGRAAAAKARIDGYNAMLAMLKRGRRFERGESTRWILEPADATEAGSAVQRLIEKARTHLERVAQDHPGTPWAQVAQEELEAKLGWRWVEN